MRNFCGTARWSVRYQLPTSTEVGLGLWSSIESSWGGSVCVSASLIRTRGTVGGGSSAPGDPPTRVLERQFDFFSDSRGGACSSTTTNEKPKPSVTGHQVSL